MAIVARLLLVQRRWCNIYFSTRCSSSTLLNGWISDSTTRKFVDCCPSWKIQEILIKPCRTLALIHLASYVFLPLFRFFSLTHSAHDENLFFFFPEPSISPCGFNSSHESASPFNEELPTLSGLFSLGCFASQSQNPPYEFTACK